MKYRLRVVFVGLPITVTVWVMDYNDRHAITRYKSRYIL